MTKTPTYILVGLLLALSVYLKSPVVGIFSVVMMAIDFLREILMKNQVVKEMEELKAINKALQTESNSQRAKIEGIEKDMIGVQRRISETIGDGI